MFVGREDELRELKSRYESDRFEFGVIYGARRIGKTSIIKESIKGWEALYFQALESSEIDNRSSFSRFVNKLLGIPYEVVYPTFSEAFDQLIKYADGKTLILVLDEIAYVANSDRGFLFELQYCIDHKFKDTRIKLLLSGSNISFMKDILKDKRAPLFQRSTFQMHITKMPFSDALAFLDGVSNEEKAKYLSVFGEYPFYLEMIDKSETFEENIKRLLFGKYGNLADAPDKILPSSVTEQGTFNAILKAIAHRRRSNKDIASYLGKSENYVAAYLPKLVENETIEKREAFSRSQKLNYYEISDNLIRFWYRFIFDRKEEISLGLGEAIYEEDKEGIDDFIAHGFEDVAIAYLTEQNVKGLLPCYYEMIRNYKVDNSKLGRSIELDGLAKGIGKSSGHLLVLECKYRNKIFSLEMLEHLKESASIFEGYSRRDYYLFSKSGFEKRVLSEGDEVHAFSLDDMFRDSV